jgi:hypothetical protein
MDWLKLLELLINLYIQMIHYLAWPVTLIIIIIVFREHIANKLQSLIKAGRKDTYLEFLSPQMEKQIQKSPKFSQINKKNYNWDNYLDALERWAAWSGMLVMKLFPIGKKAALLL